MNTAIQISADFNWISICRRFIACMAADANRSAAHSDRHCNDLILPHSI